MSINPDPALYAVGALNESMITVALNTEANINQIYIFMKGPLEESLEIEAANLCERGGPAAPKAAG
jgi:hypothetical protein